MDNFVSLEILEKMKIGESLEIGTLFPGLTKARLVWTLTEVVHKEPREWIFRVTYLGAFLCTYELTTTPTKGLQGKQV